MPLPTLQSEPSADPSEAAAAWALRIASRNLTSVEAEELEAWLAAHPSHRDELEHAQNVWQGIAPLEAVARGRKPRRRTEWRIAASLAACIGLIAVLPSVVSHDLVSPVGKVTQSVLPDGSAVWLDSGAAIDFDANATERTLHVARGRVHVSIAHDSRRPFRVLAQDTTIHDVGTTFTVDTEGPLRVAVTEGVVEIERSRSRWTVHAGMAAAFSQEQTAEPVLHPSGKENAWREGHIALEETPLSEALREADRYRRGKIVLLDSQRHDRKVSGSLSLDQLDASLEALALNQHLHLIHLPLLLIVIADEP